jgi:hypothetical protein
MRNSFIFLTACTVLLFGMDNNAVARCDHDGAPEQGGVLDSWHLQSSANRGQTNFVGASDELTKCYNVHDASKRLCDAAYSRDLKKECSKTFGFHPEALAHCNRITDESVEFIGKEANAISRKGQRQTGIKHRVEERKHRAAERRVDRYKNYNSGT